jgi:nucleoside-diphosphate-sugar epimerase
MKVFITGASGNIGTALVKELLANNHTVLGLTRSESGVEKLKSLGAEPLFGTLEDLDLLSNAASSCDAVAHLAFNHDFSNFAAACATDRAAITALGSALAGSNKPLVVTSGTMGLKKGQIGTEDDGADLADYIASMRGSETIAFSFVDKGVRVSAVRLPPVVHGEGGLGFVQLLVQPVSQSKSVAYIGTGENRWPAVHTLDAALAFRLALEKGTTGVAYHAVGEDGLAVRDVVEAIGKKLGVPAVSKTAEEAKEVFGFLATAVGADNPVSSRKTREVLGWEPTHKGLVEDIEGNLLE